MVLATAKIEDFDRFWNTFSTKGAEKRKQHGSGGRTVWIQMRATEFGRFSMGMRRGGKASRRTPMSRPSFRKPGLRKVRPKLGPVPPRARRLEQARATPTKPSLDAVCGPCGD